MDMIYELSLGL